MSKGTPLGWRVSSCKVYCDHFARNQPTTSSTFWTQQSLPRITTYRALILGRRFRETTTCWNDEASFPAHTVCNNGCMNSSSHFSFFIKRNGAQNTRCKTLDAQGYHWRRSQLWSASWFQAVAATSSNSGKAKPGKKQFLFIFFNPCNGLWRLHDPCPTSTLRVEWHGPPMALKLSHVGPM